MLDAYFTRAFYKHILGKPLSYHDFEDIDPAYYKNLKWMIENDVKGLGLTFVYPISPSNLGIHPLVMTKCDLESA